MGGGEVLNLPNGQMVAEGGLFIDGTPSSVPSTPNSVHDPHAGLGSGDVEWGWSTAAIGGFQAESGGGVDGEEFGDYPWQYSLNIGDTVDDLANVFSSDPVGSPIVRHSSDTSLSPASVTSIPNSWLPLLSESPNDLMGVYGDNTSNETEEFLYEEASYPSSPKQEEQLQRSHHSSPNPSDVISRPDIRGWTADMSTAPSLYGARPPMIRRYTNGMSDPTVVAVPSSGKVYGWTSDNEAGYNKPQMQVLRRAVRRYSHQGRSEANGSPSAPIISTAPHIAHEADGRDVKEARYSPIASNVAFGRTSLASRPRHQTQQRPQAEIQAMNNRRNSFSGNVRMRYMAMGRVSEESAEKSNQKDLQTLGTIEGRPSEGHPDLVELKPRNLLAYHKARRINQTKRDETRLRIESKQTLVDLKQIWKEQPNTPLQWEVGADLARKVGLAYQSGYCEKEDITAALGTLINDAALTVPRLIALRDLLEQIQPASRYMDRKMGESLITKLMADWSQMVQNWSANDLEEFSPTIEETVTALKGWFGMTKGNTKKRAANS